ncbi:MAG: PD-(D/E)XK nuclease family protein, partial [Oscillospiraceae bacterium]|nr:PD-(D/E)XK nuclease family protein [Oscillospiraceae bacterium]
MLQLILGRAGSGKTHRIRQMAADFVRSSGENAIMLVPEQFSFETERAMLRLMGETRSGSLEVLSFTSLYRRAAREFGGFAGVELSEGGKVILLGTALKRLHKTLNIYRGFERRPEIAESLLALFAEFKMGNITPGNLETAAFKAKNSRLCQKLLELSQIFLMFNSLVDINQYNNPQDDLTKLAGLFEKHRFLAGRTVYIDSFKGFTAQQLAVLRFVLEQAETVTITLCADSLDDYDGGVGVFSNVKKTANTIMNLARESHIKTASPEILPEPARFSHPHLLKLERELFRGTEIEEDNCTGDHLRSPASATLVCAVDSPVSVFAAETPYAEAEYVARGIRLLVRQGVRYREIAVIARDIGKYSGIIDACLDRFDIPYFVDSRRPVADFPLIRLCLSAVAAVCGGFSSEHIFACLHSGLAGMSLLETAQLENYAYIWDIDREAWLSNFTGSAEGFDGKRGGGKPPDEVNGFRKRVIAPLIRLRDRLNTAEGKPGCGVEFCKAVTDYLIDINCAEELKRYAGEISQSGDRELSVLQKRSWDILMGLLDETATALSGVDVTPREFAWLLNLLVKNSSLGAAPNELDEINIGSADRMRPAEPKAVFVLGANSEVFPESISSAGLLTAADRQELCRLGLEIADCAEAAAVDELFLAYSALCAASEKVFVTYSKSGVRGEEKEPGEIVSEIIRILPGCQSQPEKNALNRYSAPIPALEAIAQEEYSTSVRANRDHEKSSTLNLSSAELTAAARQCLLENPQTAKLLKILDSAAQNPQFSLSTRTSKALFGNDISISASKAETFFKCRFSFFCRYGLRAKPVRRAQLDAMQRGNVVHWVLEHMVEKYGGNGLTVLDPRELSTAVRELLAAYLHEFLGGHEDKSQRFHYLLERIAVSLESLITRIGDEFAQSEFRPAGTEVEISEDKVKPITLMLPDGGTVSAIGSIDRVDTFT